MPLGSHMAAWATQQVSGAHKVVEPSILQLHLDEET